MVDWIPQRRREVSDLPVLGLGEYWKLVEGIPPPTLQQIESFALHTSEAKSWYKHLPLLPPGAPFTFFLDPRAGMDRILVQDGAVMHSQRTSESPQFHHTWMTTEEYRLRFGRLAFACAAGTSLFMKVSVRLHDDREVQGFFDNNPCRASVQMAEGTEFQLPREVLEAGTIPVTGVVHRSAVSRRLWSGGFGGEADLLQWPEESGGSETGRRISALCRKAETGSAQSDAAEGSASLDEIDTELDMLLAPERRRLQAEMALAMNRVVTLVYGKPAA